MQLKVKQAGSAQELTVGSQKEFLQLYRRGIIAADDLVLRGERWVPAGHLPWIHGMALDTRRDNKRLFWITVGMMLLGLLGVLWIQSHAGTVARKTDARPKNSPPPKPKRHGSPQERPPAPRPPRTKKKPDLLLACERAVLRSGCSDHPRSGEGSEPTGDGITDQLRGDRITDLRHGRF